MKSIKHVICCFAVLSLLLAGCASYVNVKYDHDPGYNFASLKTYNWLPVQLSARANQMKINRFKNAVNSELSAKGMEVTSDNPDFLIALHGFAETKVDIDIQDYGYRYSGFWGMGTRDIDINTYEEGTVFLDFVDGESKELFWRGEATGTIEPNITPEHQGKKFADVAARLIANFPPSGN